MGRTTGNHGNIVIFVRCFGKKDDAGSQDSLDFSEKDVRVGDVLNNAVAKNNVESVFKIT